MNTNVNTVHKPACEGCGYSWDIMDLDERGLCLACVAEHDYKVKLDAIGDKRGQYYVVLASCGNIDFGQNPNRAMLGVPRKRLRVASLRAASQACRLYIAHYELGGGNWIGGAVLDHKTKVLVAQISFNGRAWKPGPFPQPEISLEVAP
jgi:hypothetical protein